VPELAYGHHRLKAVEDELGGDYAINLIVRDLDDTQMLQMMARENMEEWGASFPVVLDTIRVAVKAFAEGRVEFDPVPEKTKKCTSEAHRRSYRDVPLMVGIILIQPLL